MSYPSNKFWFLQRSCYLQYIFTMRNKQNIYPYHIFHTTFIISINEHIFIYAGWVFCIWCANVWNLISFPHTIPHPALVFHIYIYVFMYLYIYICICHNASSILFFLIPFSSCSLNYHRISWSPSLDIYWWLDKIVCLIILQAPMT